MNHLKKHYFFWLFLILVNSVFASKVTIDADGGATYTSLDEALSNLSTDDPDTVLFIGNDQDTYAWSIGVSLSIGTVIIRGSATDPDLFPIINQSVDAYGFYTNTRIYLENLIITPSVGIHTGLSTTHGFSNCIFRNSTTTDYVLQFAGDSNSSITITNCLFEGNATGNIFKLDYWGDAALTIMNCTFDNNASLWNTDLTSHTANIAITNCIFSSNTITFKGDSLRSVTTYSLTDEAVTKYGTGCISNNNPIYHTSSSREEPTDWIIATGSPAEGIGTLTGAPSIDISSNPRSGSIDAGCWKAQSGGYIWDLSSANDIQTGTGIWNSTNSYWTAFGSSGTSLVAWPGSGNKAIFAGSGGAYTISIDSIQALKNLTVSTNNYTFTGGTLHFDGESEITIANSVSTTVGATLTSSSGIIKTGEGSLILTGTNTSTTTISEGTLQIGNNGLSGSISNSSNIINNTSLIFYRSDPYTYGGVISGSGTVIKNGTSTLTLTGNNTYTGATTISSGTLQIGTNGTTGAISSASSISNNGILIFNRSDTYSYTGIVSGTGALTKNGSGICTLSGMNTYTGNTTVLAGELQVTGSLASGSAVNIASGAILSGTGIVNGIVNVNGTIAPGTTGYGTFTFGDSITFSSSGSLSSTIGGTTAGVNYDQIIINAGTLTLANALLSLSLSYAPRSSDICTLINNATSNAINGIFTGYAQGSTIALNYNSISYDFTVSYIGGTGNDVTLTCTGPSIIDTSAVNITTCTFDSTAAAIHVGWSLDTAKYDGLFDIGIAYSPGNYPTDMNSGITIAAPPAIGNTTLHSNILLPDTIYYVSLFVRKPGGTWIGPANSMNDTTRTGALIIADAAKITTCAFDSAAATIRVGWNIDTTKYKGLFDIGIACSPANFPADMNSGEIVALPPATGTTLLESKTLLPDTTYYVSLFVRKPTGVWNGATDSLRDTVRTGAMLIADASKITTCTFIAASGAINVGWHVDTTKYNGSFDIGIAYSTGTYPVDMINGITITTPSKNDDTLLKPSPFLSDTLYYVSIFVRKPNGTWIGATDSLRDTVRTKAVLTADAAKITASTFDSTAASIRVGWKIDTAKYNDLFDIGIVYSLDNYATDMSGGTIITAPSINDDTLLKPLPLLPDTIYYVSLFVRNPLGEWLGGTDSLRDTVRTGASIIADAAKITICTFDSTTAALRIGWNIDTTKYTGLFEIGIACSPDTFPADMNSGITVATPAANGSTLFQSNSLFPDTLYYVSLFVRKPGGKWIGAKDSLRDTVRTGASIIADAAKITVCAFDSTTAAIRVGWNIDTLKYNGPFEIGIACNPGTFPADMNNGISITTPAASGNTLFQSTSLLPDTMYYVSLYVRKPGGKWVGATDSLRDTVRTGLSILTNAATISTLSFDSASAAISIGWNVDTTKYNGPFEIGITFNLMSYPVDMSSGIIIATPSINSDTLLKPTPLLVDTLYYISLFIRKPGGKWAGPTDVMQGTVLTGRSVIADAAKMTVCTFDSTAAAIKIGWNIDTTKYNGPFDVGIAYNILNYPINMIGGTVISPSSTNGVTLLKPSFLLPDTLYHVALFVRKPGGEWIGATDSLRDTVRTSSSLIVNAAKITMCSFDSTAAAIRVGWNIDTTKYNGPFEIAITHNLETYADTVSNGLIITTAPVNGDTLLKPALFPIDTTFYIALFVRKPGGEWTGVTDSLRDTVRTGTSLLINAAKLTMCSFDTAAAAIRIGWYIDTIKYNSPFDIGVIYSLDSFPSDFNNGTILSVPPANSDTLLRLIPLLSDTLYYIALFVRKPAGKWIGTTDSLQDTIRTGKIFRDIAQFSNRTPGDTIEVFNKQVILIADSNSNVSADTLEIYPFTAPKGFTSIGTSFKFVHPRPTAPSGITIGIRINELPDSVSIQHARIYHDSAGVLKVNYQSKVDSLNRIVYVSTNDIHLPFIAMIDLQKPVVESASQDSTPVYPGIDLVDSVSISDNIFNAHWEHLYSRGDSTLKVQDSGTLSAAHETIRLTIPDSSDAISAESGVLSVLIVNDGVQYDTINLSRSVYRDTSNLFITKKEIWQPVYSTAVLSNPGPDSLIIARSVGESPVYDIRYRRLFRWVETISNSNTVKKWIEYDPVNTATIVHFHMIPGRMFWLKTKDNDTLNLGPGYTVSQRKPFSFTLPPKQFTDFSTPFRFGIQIRDILSESGDAIDSIQIYEWQFNDTTKQYRCVPFYIKGMAGKSDSSQMITFEKTGAYCLYNPSEQAVTINIPSIPKPKNTPKSLAKKKSDPTWGVTFMATNGNGNALPALYCGYAPGFKKSNYPLAPSFEDVQVFLYDRTFSKHQGHYIADDASDGFAREIHLSNASDSAREISYRFETEGSLPETFTPYLFDNTTKQYSLTGTITVAPNSTISRWFVVGDSQWRDRFTVTASSFRYAIQQLYPNPARSTVTIRYSVGMSIQKRMNITIFDLHGRTVWEKRIDKPLAPGNHWLTWDGTGMTHAKVGAGMYLLRMSVLDTKGKTVQKFDQRFTFLP